MNEIKCLEKQLELMRMCEGTKVKWWECVQNFWFGKWQTRYGGNPNRAYDNPHNDGHDRFAIQIVEDKPVFEGDELYDPEGKKHTMVDGQLSMMGYRFNQCTWNPPKPRTVMVELTVEDAEYLSNYEGRYGNYQRIGGACRKELDKL